MASAEKHTMGLATRLLIVAAATASLSAVTAILLVQNFGATLNAVPIMVYAITVPATLAASIHYLYWFPRHARSRATDRLLFKGGSSVE
jgi:hypothetical protein